VTEPAHSLRILLAEDSEEDAFLLLRHLRKVGYEIESRRVESSTEFVQALRDGVWDLVISDFQMPHFSGMEALSLTRGIDPDIPFFLVSGAIGEDIAVEAMRAGASDYLIKGNLTRLGPAIDRELRETSSRRRQKETERRQQQLESAIQSILLGTASVTGVDFFRSLVRELAQALGMKVATIVETAGSGGSHARVLAIQGLDTISEGFEYELAGTPGEAILRDGWLLLRDIQASSLRTFGLATSFGLTGLIGLRLDDSAGRPLGLLVVFDDQPISEEGLAKDILAIFGARAASELERLRAEKERNELQEQLWHSQKLEAIGTLAGGISHDINNILSSIWGHAQILEMRRSVPERDQESLQGILSACRRARDLVRQILSFSRKTPLEASTVQIGEIVQETATLLKATLPASVLMECTIDPSTPSVKADPNQMHQVLMNLCTNASHAMATDGGRLSIRVSPVETSQGRMARCQVSDTGSGIPEDVLPRIFEPFFTTKGPGKGTGLGLSVVHGIVRNHGGSITVQSEPGKGTTFTFDLPAAKTRDPDSAASADRSEMPVGESQRILVVDDEDAVSDVLCQLLDILGYKPTSCQDPRAALELFRKDPRAWSAVITDRTMPGLSGEALACALHDLRPDLPIIMSSGYEGDIRSGDLSKKGVSALLPKPFQASDLATTLRRILGG
jgi:signal transduction histidine kinase